MGLGSLFGAVFPEMGVAAMAISFVVVPVVSLLTQNRDEQRVKEIFSCYDEQSSKE